MARVHAEIDEFDACEVCGRSMLRGERTRAYKTPEGERRAVCDLCRVGVQSAGWVRVDPPSERRPAPNTEERSPRRRSGPLRRSRWAGESPQRRLRRALERFNRSEYRRTVEGLTRSLGEPRVSAVTPAERPEEVRLTVAWELSWYQWAVKLADREITVQALGQGKEVRELNPADRAWNAHAAEDGRLKLSIAGNGGGPK